MMIEKDGSFGDDRDRKAPKSGSYDRILNLSLGARLLLLIIPRRNREYLIGDLVQELRDRWLSQQTRSGVRSWYQKQIFHSALRYLPQSLKSALSTGIWFQTKQLRVTIGLITAILVMSVTITQLDQVARVQQKKETKPTQFVSKTLHPKEVGPDTRPSHSRVHGGGEYVENRFDGDPVPEGQPNRAAGVTSGSTNQGTASHSVHIELSESVTVSDTASVSRIEASPQRSESQGSSLDNSSPLLPTNWRGGSGVCVNTYSEIVAVGCTDSSCSIACVSDIAVLQGI